MTEEQIKTKIERMELSLAEMKKCKDSNYENAIIHRELEIKTLKDVLECDKY